MQRTNFLGALRVSLAALAGTFAVIGCSGDAGSGSPGAAAPLPTRIGHVFTIVLENKDYTETFAPDTPAPYLARTLAAQGARVEGYYGIGHVSLDNYIGMISGQGPNPVTQSDCMTFQEFQPSNATPDSSLDNQAVGQGCIYPAAVPSLPDQLKAKSISWKGYMEDMGNDPSRGVKATCGHPVIGQQDHTQSASASDSYATRHDPFMYFHSIIDDQLYCDAHVVNLSALDADLTTLEGTPQYVFVTPSLCSDGHDAPCANGDPGGLREIDHFLQVWVPKILASPAFGKDGLLIITFDESDYTGSRDASACCGETTSANSPRPGITGAGGGKVGAILISRFITPGTVVDPGTHQYNHYSMLRSVEDIFGLDYLGYAGASGQASFGPEIFTAQMPEFPAKH